ncbi:transcriptional regulator [Christensenella intestinihominis]|uniref:transcriptional regulator n=1 Tax=Christensenella intestinihominis TaxID=1851429 RepID=UPI0011C96A8B|nr:transcriptional regulator [Christensenella intestinihominis]
MGRYLKIAGQRFGKLTALHRVEDGTKGYAKWLCRCDCGNETIVNTKWLSRGTVTNCGCIPKKTAKNGQRAENLKGRRFGKLTVLTRAENKNGKVCWLCRCDCGREKIYTARDLKAGQKSCGCIRGLNDKKYKDISGHKFGRLLALEATKHRDKKGSVKWKCICDCGKKCLVTEDSLVSGNTVSCGCRKAEINKEMGRLVSFIDGTSYELLKFRKNTRSDSKSGYRGITITRHGRYQVHIGFKRKKYYLGNYENLAEALAVRKEAEEVVHKGFCDAYERWKKLSKELYDWEKLNPLVYEVSLIKKEFYIESNIDELERRCFKRNE